MAGRQGLRSRVSTIQARPCPLFLSVLWIVVLRSAPACYPSAQLIEQLLQIRCSVHYLHTTQLSVLDVGLFALEKSLRQLRLTMLLIDARFEENVEYGWRFLLINYTLVVNIILFDVWWVLMYGSLSWSFIRSHKI